MNYIDWFKNVEPTLHYWDRSGYNYEANFTGLTGETDKSTNIAGNFNTQYLMEKVDRKLVKI